MPNAAGGSSGSAGDAQSESYSQLTGLKVIFDSIDLDQSGTLSRSELEAVLKKIGEEEDERTLGRLLDAFTQSDEEITFKKFVTEITRPRKRNAAGNAALFLLLIVLPFLYHFVVSLPFMFLALDGEPVAQRHQCECFRRQRAAGRGWALWTRRHPDANEYHHAFVPGLSFIRQCPHWVVWGPCRTRA